MPVKISTGQPDFQEAFMRFLSMRNAGAEQVGDTVRDILARVQAEGDAALFSYTTQFDRFEANADTIRVTAQENANALSLCQPELMTSLKIAARRIREYSERQMPADLDYVDELGIRLGHRWSPLDSVGLYVPGGLAAYPSSVLMNAVPAKVAGVKRLVVAVPAPDGKVSPAVLAA